MDFKKKLATIGAYSEDLGIEYAAQVAYKGCIIEAEGRAVLAALSSGYDKTKCIRICIDCEGVYKLLGKPTGKEPERLKTLRKEIKRRCKLWGCVEIDLIDRFFNRAHSLSLILLRKLRTED